MPIILPEGLPARNALLGDGVVATGHAAPLKVALVNLMPRKIDTEFHIARALSASPHTIDVTLLLPSGHSPKTTHGDHIHRYYRRWEEVADRHFDGLIVTGAPVEHLPFDEVNYWPSLMRLFDWSATHVGHSLHICWAAQAALYHRHGIGKRALTAKAFGVFEQDVRTRHHPLVRGMGSIMTTPVSRHTTVDQRDIDVVTDLATVASSRTTGPCLVADDGRRASYMFNHLEYGADTLVREYRRDLAAGLVIRPPVNLDLRSRMSRAAPPSWQRDAELFFQNWVVGLARHRHVGAGHPDAPCGGYRMVG